MGNLLDALLGGVIIQENGVPMPRRRTIDFVGLDVADDPDNDRLLVTAPTSPGAIVTIKYVHQLGGLSAYSVTAIDIPDLQMVTAPGELWVIQWALWVACPAGFRVQIIWPFSPTVANARALFVSTQGNANPITPVIMHASVNGIPYQDLVFLPGPGITEGYLTIDLVLHNDAGSGPAKVMFGTASGTGPAIVARGSYMRAYRSS